MQGKLTHKVQHKKTNWLALFVFIVAVLFVVGICGTWSLITTNAVASEESFTQDTESTEDFPIAEEVTNDTVKISFNFTGLPEGVVPGCELKISGATQSYTFGEKITVKAPGRDFNYMNEGSIYKVYFWDANDELYQFTWISPKGYDPVSIEPSDISSITDNLDFLITYQKYQGNFQVDFNVIATSHSGDIYIIPVEGYQIKIYDKNDHLIGEGATDAQGKLSLTGINLDQTEGYITGELSGYSDYSLNFNYMDFDQEHKFMVFFGVSYSESAYLQLLSASSHHNLFKVCKTIYSETDPSVVIDQTTMIKDNIATDVFENSFMTTYSIREDGSIFSNDQRTTLEIKAICENGYVVDHWDVTYSDGSVGSYNPGQSFTRELILPRPPLKLEVFYTEAPPEPGPEPTPTPSEESIVTAQTGDSCQSVIPLAILAALCATVLIARRRISQN